MERNFGYTPLPVSRKKFDAGLLRAREGFVIGFWVGHSTGHWWFAPNWWKVM